MEFKIKPTQLMSSVIGYNYSVSLKKQKDIKKSIKKQGVLKF